MFERLTARSTKNNMAYLVKVKPGEQEVESKYPNTLKAILEAFDHLATYEESGLTPEEVQEIAKAKSEGRLLIRPFTWEELNKQKSFVAKLGGKEDV